MHKRNRYFETLHKYNVGNMIAIAHVSSDEV